jgi:hypothetical protein
METPFLIQRASFEDRDFKKGIDSIINLDYMGSSEFEWGSIPKSLGNIRSRINQYTYLDVPLGDKVISVFCKDEQKSEIRTYLKELSENKFHLKEYSDFNTYINPSKHDIEWQAKRPHDTDFWWDLDNDIMFWKKNPEFEIKFKSIIPVKPL